jgi:hypothetical protein
MIPNTNREGTRPSGPTQSFIALALSDSLKSADTDGYASETFENSLLSGPWYRSPVPREL